MHLLRSPGSLISKLVNIFIAGLVSCIIIVSHAAVSFARNDIEGVWIDDTGKGAVRIMPCGEDSSLCGYIVWLEAGKSRDGIPLRDKLNPDPKKRHRLICGLQVIGQLQPKPASGWDQGWIYDPKQGQSFDVAVRRLTEDRIEILGYLGIKFLGKKFIWERAPENIKFCSE